MTGTAKNLNVKQKMTGLEVAIIGMAGRFSRAKNIGEFWNNLKKGVESVSFFSDQELVEDGIPPKLIKRSEYVKARCMLEDKEYFDATFFNYSPKEAEVMDPQVRIFHEVSWEVLEHAGYDPMSFDGMIGLYAGASPSFLWRVLIELSGKSDVLGHWVTSLLNEKDYMCTRISYKMNLKGPSFTLGTACSTSLVAVHLACRALLTGECKIALAGGISIHTIKKEGYLYQEGMIGAPDGHCRAFSAKAGGTTSGEGVGLVVLKRLNYARQDGDYIHAVIKGSGINNDGVRKVGYTAPSTLGQSELIRRVQEISQVEPQSVSYIETHGTGTGFGDPIEIEALKQAFNTDKKNFCSLGALKTNIGHLNEAAGIAGLIKTTLALKYRLIPPTLHYETPNPKIDFENSPFFVNTTLRKWTQKDGPLRAGVSAFGLGGTNAHVILEEAPPIKSSSTNRSPQLFLLSAKTKTALQRVTENLADYLETYPGINIGDAAYTLKVGRQGFEHRRMFLCPDVNEAIEVLRSPASGRLHTFFAKEDNPPVVFMFSGQGSQYINMGVGIYQTEKVFRQEVNRCFGILSPLIGYNLKEILYPGEGTAQSLERKAKNWTKTPSLKDTPLKGSHELCVGRHAIDQTKIAQPVIFIFEYAMAKLLMKWGIVPQAMIGHSIGEYVAACLSGLFSLEDALKLVLFRGELMQEMPVGAMLSIPITEEELLPLLNHDISLAAVNAPEICVVSGSYRAIDTFDQMMKEKGYKCTRLHTSHAFHSKMMEPMLEEFQKRFDPVKLNPPTIPYISNVTGKWITNEEAANPGYWVTHLRKTVRFYDGLKELLKEEKVIFVEVGAGNALSSLLNKHTDKKDGHKVINLVKHPNENIPDYDYLLNKIGHLWLYGASLNWRAYYSGEMRQRIPLPTYPFERQLYTVEAELKNFKSQELSQKIFTDHTDMEMSSPTTTPGERERVSDWFYVPTWKRSDLTPDQKSTFPVETNVLVFIGDSDCNLGFLLVKRLESQCRNVTTVKAGKRFEKESDHQYVINPEESNHYIALFKEFQQLEIIPTTVVHFGNVKPGEEGDRKPGSEASKEILSTGFHSLIYIVQAIGKLGIIDDIQLQVVTDNMQKVTGDEVLIPAKATVLGPAKVIPLEYPNIDCYSIDIVLPEPGKAVDDKLIDQLMEELSVDSRDKVIAYRNYHRWVQTFEQVRLPSPPGVPSRLKRQGVYFISGGLGGIGLVLSEYLARTVEAKLILTGRSSFPARDHWQEWLDTHDDEDNTSLNIRKLQEIESCGGEVFVLSVDVSNREQMRKALTSIQEQVGRINGVIHAAGVPDGTMIQRRNRHTSEGIFAPKIDGILVLDSILEDVELDFLFICSSLSSILGPFAQVGYCAANAFLDAFAHYKASSGSTFTVSVNWDLWQEVGMAVKSMNKLSGEQNISKPQAKKVMHPLFDQWLKDESDQEIYISYFQVDKYWVLDEHRVINGQATLPGTGYLEMVTAALKNHVNDGAIEIGDMYFPKPLVLEEGEEREVRTILRREGNDFDFVIISQSNSGTFETEEHARGKVVGIGAIPPVKHDIQALKEQCNEKEIIVTEQHHHSPLYGPRWRNCKWIRFGDRKGLAFLELPEEFAGDLEDFKFHPALMDNATGFLFEATQKDSVYLPFSYKKLIIKSPLPISVYSYITYARSNPSPNEHLVFDIIIMDKEGVEVAVVEEYAFKKIEKELVQGGASCKFVNKSLSISESQAFTLEVSTPGLLDSLAFKPISRREPGPGEVEIETITIGLNFRDVLMALGTVGSGSKEPLKFGFECTGKIVSVGKEVNEFKVGDDVIALYNPSFSSYITLPASRAAMKPNHLNFEEAATIPLAFMTAYYSLVQLAKLSRHERVLIHAAAGGVGMAAVKIAQWLGAEIFATAGSQKKRNFLYSLGIKHVMNSRTLDFADEVMKHTGGRGVDVVLNSLAGEFIPKSLSILAPYGRFVEIGIRDIQNNSQLGLRPFEKSLAFFSVMLGINMPNYISLWKEVVQHFENGDFSPLPYRTFPITKVSDAFNHMARAEHIGKIVFSLKSEKEITTRQGSSTGIKSRETGKAAGEELLSYGTRPDEGVDIFKRILAGTLNQVVVSIKDLEVEIKQRMAADVKNIHEKFKQKTSTGTIAKRPELSTEYVAPRNKLEDTISSTFRKFYGLDKIGVHDNFFELGASSLDLVQISSKLKKSLGKEVSIITLFEYPTVASIAGYLEPEREGESPGTYQEDVIDRGKNKLRQLKKQVNGGPDG